MDKFKLLSIDFGVGDVLMTTPLIRSIKKKCVEENKKLAVACIYSDILRFNPNIDLLLQLGTMNDMYRIFKEIKDPSDFICLKPYENQSQWFGNEPMSKLFCDLAGYEYDNDKLDIFLTKEEEEFGTEFTKRFKKPLIILQVESARVSLRGGEKMITEKDWFNERWDAVVDALKDKYDFIQVGGKDEYRVKGINCSLLGKTTYRESAAILKNCFTFITIDSAVSHLGPAVGKTGIVLFGRSKVSALGHKYNTNIIVRESCPDIECLRPNPSVGDLMLNKENQLTNWVCPDKVCMKAITPEMVIDAVKNFKYCKIPEINNEA